MSRKKSKKQNVNIFAIIIIIAIIIGIIVSIVILIENRKAKYDVTVSKIEENDIKYFVLVKDDKYGVIDKNGNVIIEPKYQQINIPNPTKDIFIVANESNEKNFKAINSKSEQILSQYEDVEAIEIKQISSLVPYEKDVLKYKSGNYYGIINLDGTKITDAIYESIESIDYKEGCLKVSQKGKTGEINIKGATLIKSEYDDIQSDGYYNEKTKYSDAGYILREKTDSGYRYGYAEKNGKILLETNYSELVRITDVPSDDNNIYLITSSNGRYGLVRNKENIIKNDYDELLFDSKNRIIIAQKEDTKGVFDLNGKTILPMDYSDINIGGDYLIATKEGKKLKFDKNGKQISMDYLSYEKVNDNIAIIVNNENRYNLIDINSNKIMLKNFYDYIEFYKNDLFIVTSEGKTGIIDKLGNEKAEVKYSSIKEITGTKILQVIEYDNNKIDIVDENGKFIEGIENANIEVEDNYIKIYSDTDCKYFKLDGTPTTYKELYPNNKLYASKQNGKWGFVDSNGKQVILNKYEMCTEQFGNYVAFKQDGKWGICDTDGNIVLQPTYTLAKNNVKFLGIYYQINEYYGVPVYCGTEEYYFI